MNNFWNFFRIFGILSILGCYEQGNKFKVREKSGDFVSGQGISESLFKVGESQGILY